MAIEWIRGTKHFLIDCSQYDTPRFIVAPSHNPESARRHMTRDEALKAVDYASKYFEAYDRVLLSLAESTHLWPLLEIHANWSSSTSIPTP